MVKYEKISTARRANAQTIHICHTNRIYFKSSPLVVSIITLSLKDICPNANSYDFFPIKSPKLDYIKWVWESSDQHVSTDAIFPQNPFITLAIGSQLAQKVLLSCIPVTLNQGQQTSTYQNVEFRSTYHHLGLVLRRSSREQKIPGSNPACARIFFGSSHTSDLKIGTPVATLPGAWRYRLAQCQYAETRWGTKFDLQLLSQCGST